MSDDGHVISELHVEDFRTMRDLSIDLGPVCALVGEAQAGKSNVLAALRAVADPAGAPVRQTDVRRGAAGLQVRARLSGGAWLGLRAKPQLVSVDGDGRPAVLFLAAAERDAGVVEPPARPDGEPQEVRLFRAQVQRALDRRGDRSPAIPAQAMTEAFEACCHRRVAGLLVLIEEPELYLRPQTQRYLSRLLRRLADLGNQVVYSTHAPAFLKVARVDELVFVERRSESGTKALRPPPLTPDEDFRILSEFDAERAELFLARAALLVEGETEKLALPFVFAALGEDADREGISIVECGGKSNLVLFARVCRAAGVPFVVLHDRDARPGRRPSAANRLLHEALDSIATPEHIVELAPDFEAVSHLPRGGGRKPEHAWRRFAHLPIERMPGDLIRAVKLTLHLARSATPRSERAIRG